MNSILLTQDPDDIFYSPSGEGIHLGIPKVFIRAQICPFRCRYCDSASTWEKKDGIVRSFDYIYEKVLELGNGFFTPEAKVEFEISGGEIAAQIDPTAAMISFLKSKWPNAKFSMQTSGGIYNEKFQKLLDMADHISFDRKDLYEKIPFKIPTDKIRGCDEVKMLICDDATYIDTRDFIRNNPIKGKYVITAITDYQRPEELVQEHVDNLRGIIERALADKEFDTTNVQFFPRLHSILWLTKKGV